MTVFTQNTDSQNDDDRDGEHFRRHIYAPGDEAVMITVAEVRRLRAVEVVAWELARAVNFEATIIGKGTEYSAELLSRARAVGLLTAETK